MPAFWAVGWIGTDDQQPGAHGIERGLHFRPRFGSVSGSPTRTISWRQAACWRAAGSAAAGSDGQPEGGLRGKQRPGAPPDPVGRSGVAHSKQGENGDFG